MIKSPMNYTGGKYKLLPQILPLFPKKIDTFVDLFCGGCNVGINVEANKIICNDHIDYIIDLYNYFKSTNVDLIIEKIKETIKYFDLSLINQDGYNALRNRYNKDKNILDLFILSCYSFNHQIRFNNKHKFNTSFGKNRSQYNFNIENNLINFCNKLKQFDISFLNKDFMNFNFSLLDCDDLVYCDPPYLISTGAYNDGKRGFKDWTEKEEKQLLSLLDKLNSKNIRFALSNVLYHKGMSNDLLIEWSKKYKVHYLNANYKNCNYHLKEKSQETIEVLITNY